MKPFILIAAAIATLAAQPAPTTEPFRNPALSDEARLTDLISRLTLDEKIANLGTNPGAPRLGIKSTLHVEGLHGLAYGGPSNWGSRNPMPTTIFPQAVGLAATWDVDALHRVGAIEGYEARFIAQSPRWSRGGLIIRSPNADLARDIRWGRTEESYGEDPFLAGTLATAMIRGLQGEDPRYWQAASLMKHLLANSNENTRESSSSDFDERLLREYYGVPFRMGVTEGHANAFMAAYNKVNGIPCTVQPFLREMTMRDWGLNGIICTDGGALRLLVTAHKAFPTLTEAAAASIKSGITVFLDRYEDAVRDALAKGLITEADLDRAMVRNFRVMLRLGFLDPPERVPYARIGVRSENAPVPRSGVRSENAPGPVSEHGAFSDLTPGAEHDAFSDLTPDPWTTPEHKAAVRHVTDESIVLLKNDTNLLPLDPARLKSIAVIGPRASSVLLDWYSGTPPYTVTPLDGIRARAGERVKVEFAADNSNGAAAALARAADVAVVIVGNHPTCDAPWLKCPVASDGKEAVDRRAIDLEQETLVKDVFAANPRTIVVLKASFPFAITWSQQHVPAILTMAHNSQEEGHALADVLFGDYNPAGRLVHTWPRSIDQLPEILDYDIRHGRTYMYFKGEPLYPFGYGLSYSTFEYKNVTVNTRQFAAGESATVGVDVKNASTRAGDEVVQLYAAYPASKVARPARQLIAFDRVTIAPGETKHVALSIRAEQFAYWDAGQHRFVIEAAPIDLLVGTSSADIRLRSKIDVR